MKHNNSIFTHRNEFVAALGPAAPDYAMVDTDGLGDGRYNRLLGSAIWEAITSQRIVGRLALRYIEQTEMVIHGTPHRRSDIGDTLYPHAPTRLDLKGRKYPMGGAAVCASKGDIELPLRKALLHHNRPELANKGPILWRCKDSLGRPWHFTSKRVLDTVRDAELTGTALFWRDYEETPPFFDRATGELYQTERWIPHDVKLARKYWTPVTLDDLPLDYNPQLPVTPEQDLFVIDASPADAMAYLQLVPSARNFIQLSDDMGISVTALSGHYPSQLHPMMSV